MNDRSRPYQQDELDHENSAEAEIIPSADARPQNAHGQQTNDEHRPHHAALPAERGALKHITAATKLQHHGKESEFEDVDDYEHWQLCEIEEKPLMQAKIFQPCLGQGKIANREDNKVLATIGTQPRIDTF